MLQPDRAAKQDNRQAAAPVAAILFAATVLGLVTGCASPGPPRAPSLRLPRVVRNLQALRQGNSVQLQWTAPQDTTDGQPLWHKHAPEPMTAVVCRVEASRCDDVVTLPVAPGQPYSALDQLPPALLAGAPRPLAYRIRVQNGAKRDAGSSGRVWTLAGAAPPPVQDLTATTVAAGVQLTWKAAAGGAVRVEAETASGAKQPTTRLLQVSASGVPRPASAPAGTDADLAPVDAGGAIDPIPAVGTRVTYRVYRQRTVVVEGAKLALRGEAAQVSAVRSADAFPPAAPTGLLVQSFRTEGEGVSASLSWEPNGEPDVAGYYVYRAGASGEFSRLTPVLVRGVNFNDTQQNGLAAGQQYRYAITAVDRAGNESRRSAVVAVEIYGPQ